MADWYERYHTVRTADVTVNMYWSLLGSQLDGRSATTWRTVARLLWRRECRDDVCCHEWSCLGPRMGWSQTSTTESNENITCYKKFIQIYQSCFECFGYRVHRESRHKFKNLLEEFSRKFFLKIRNLATDEEFHGHFSSIQVKVHYYV